MEQMLLDCQQDRSAVRIATGKTIQKSGSTNGEGFQIKLRQIRTRKDLAARVTGRAQIRCQAEKRLATNSRAVPLASVVSGDQCLKDMLALFESQPLSQGQRVRVSSPRRR